MHKLHKYIRRFTKDIVESPKSTYYKFNGHILRVSDHIGSSSSGCFSIIITGDNYVLHNHTSGLLTVLSYKETLGFVKGVALCSSMMINHQENIRQFTTNTPTTEVVIKYPELNIKVDKAEKLYKLLSQSQKREIRERFNWNDGNINPRKAEILSNDDMFKNMIKQMLF